MVYIFAVHSCYRVSYTDTAFRYTGNGPYSSFHLEARFCGQKDKNSHSFGFTIDMVVVIDDYAEDGGSEVV